MAKQDFFRKFFYYLLIISISLALPVFAEKLKVGVIAGFTGDWASYGMAYRQGIELAKVEDQVEFIYEDDQFSSTKTIAAYRKLVENENVQAVIIGDTVTARAIVTLSLKYQIPTFVWASQEKVFSEHPYIIRLWPLNIEESLVNQKFVREYFSNELQIVTQSHSYTETWAQSLLDLSTKDFHVSREDFPATAQDFKPFILRSKAQQKNNFALCLYPGNNALFLQQLQSLNLSAKIFACNFIEAKSDLANLRSYSGEIVFSASKIRSEFMERYFQQHGDSDHLVSAAIMYDAAQILHASQRYQHANLMDRIAQVVNFSSAHQGAQLVWLEKDHYLRFPFAFYQVVKGQIQKASKD